MLLRLNSEKLLLRDIRNFSHENSHAIKNSNKSENRLSGLFLNLAKGLGKAAILNFQLSGALRDVKNKIKADHKEFKKSDFRAKEDLLIKWEKLARIIKTHSNNNLKSTFFLIRGISTKTEKIKCEINNFIELLKSELYPNTNNALSQDHLTNLAEKFKHLPQDVLEDLTSNEYTECI